MTLNPKLCNLAAEGFEDKSRDGHLVSSKVGLHVHFASAVVGFSFSPLCAAQIVQVVLLCELEHDHCGPP